MQEKYMMIWTKWRSGFNKIFRTQVFLARMKKNRAFGLDGNTYKCSDMTSNIGIDCFSRLFDKILITSKNTCRMEKEYSGLFHKNNGDI